MGNRRKREEEEMEEAARMENKRKKENCVCDALIHIKKAQDEAEASMSGQCRNSCFNTLLSGNGNNNGRDTVPFLLQQKDGTYFHAIGALGENDCFQTVFFRVEKVFKEDCCAILSLLRPDCMIEFNKCCVDPESLCGIDELNRTRDCIHVDLDCFCAVQCLDPDLVDS
ncbi:CotY/CotZ family spore coat protein [Salibacterium sp. K-3]